MKPKLLAKVDQAKKVISDQCVNGQWQMCSPVQKDDSDIVLTDTIDALVAEISHLEARLKVYEPSQVNFYDLPIREVRHF